MVVALRDGGEGAGKQGFYLEGNFQLEREEASQVKVKDLFRLFKVTGFAPSGN